MKLSELVNFYNQLCDMTTTGVRFSTDLELQKIIHASQDSNLSNLRSELLESFDRFESGFDQLKSSVYDQIRQEEGPYLQESYKIYELHRAYRYAWLKKPHPTDSIEVQEKNLQMHVDNILNNHLPMVGQTQELIMNRITRCSGWQTTTMILRPGLEPWLPGMVSNDPIYLVDENYDLLKPIMSQFNEIYQRRLRTYTIREDEEQDILWQLPNNQFGLVLAWNYFNHRPFEILRRYLTELYTKIRPGGMLLMTYNDCDRWPGVLAAETGTALYTPGGLIKSFAESLGFEETFSYNDTGPWTWLELRKPGEWKSSRHGQSLAKILPKSVA
jgi:hypothetical protein